MPWLVQSVRLSMFVTPEALRVEAPSWEALTDAAPENRAAKRSIVSAEEGPFGGGRLRLQVQQAPPPRIDLLFAPRSLGAGTEGPPTIGTFNDVANSIREPSGRLLRSGIETVRIALGVVHIQPASDWADAGRIIQAAAGPARLNLTDARDFLYRVNRPRPSRAVPELRINRLATWSGVIWQEVLIDVASGQSSGGGVAGVSAGLETDFSTDEGRREPIPIPQRLQLLEELHQLTVEVASNGDVP